MVKCLPVQAMKSTMDMSKIVYTADADKQIFQDGALDIINKLCCNI